MSSSLASRLQISLFQARHMHRLHRVNMLEPGLCRVVFGTKRIFVGTQSIAATSGQWSLLPAHVPMDVENEPGSQGYLAQVLTFSPHWLGEFQTWHAAQLPAPDLKMGLQHWRLPRDARLDAAWKQLEESLALEESPVLQKHHLHGLWLIIGLSGRLWPLLAASGTDLALRVQQVLMSDPSANWMQGDVANRLHMSSPTLRRHLATEGQSFRAILDEVRMAQALNHIQTTRKSIEDIEIGRAHV